MLRGPCDTELAIGGFYLMSSSPCWCAERNRKKSWELDSIIMQNMGHNLLLFCARTWPSYHVIEDHLLLFKSPESKKSSNCLKN